MDYRKDLYFCFTNYTKDFDCVNHTHFDITLPKLVYQSFTTELIIKEMGYPCGILHFFLITEEITPLVIIQ